MSAQTRGRSVPMSDQEHVLQVGTGWVPADLAINAFGLISPDNIFGSVGDLRLLPDRNSVVDIPSDSAIPGVRVYLADQVLPDGSPWNCCPRTFLRQALRDLREQTGLQLAASFEHEFMVRDSPLTAPFSFARFRSGEPFGTDFVQLLDGTGLNPDSWLPEYGAGQYEVTLGAANGLIAADRAILLRELVRDLARRRGLRVTFAPLLEPGGVGNGVHVHLFLRDAEGGPAFWDPGRPGRLSRLGARFAAGILQHAAALTAVTAPSVASFLRLVPHRWSAGGIFLADRNREALLRICPLVSLGGRDPAGQLRLEYRGCDATANPWLVLGILVRAALEGIRHDYTEPVVFSEAATDVDLASVPALPKSLEEALAALEADATVRSWFHPDLLATHLSVKRSELATVAHLDEAGRCHAIADVY
ncbi:MAG: glutamine synthetase [Candidatus Dormiibacter spiritus]|nr:MAG: glutamine synthetase [Candidatus Dormibacteraeota bacterium]